MPVIQDQELLYTLLSEGRLDLMYLPAGAIAWLWKDERPEEQVLAATALGVAARDINPIVDASILKSDHNILILKCEDGQAFRVYPGGGYSTDGSDMMELHSAVAAMQHNVPNEVQDDELPCDYVDAQAIPAADDGFERMAVSLALDPKDVISAGPVDLDQLLRRADDIDMDEGYGDQPRYGQYYTYDELASETARDIQAHSGEDTSEYDGSDCDHDIEGTVSCDDGGLPHDHSSMHHTEDSFDFSDLKKKN